MRRRTARPFGQSTSGIRLVSMIMAMLVLWMLYGRLKDPATWRLIADDQPAPSETRPEPAPRTSEPNPTALEAQSMGANDQDPDEMAAMRDLLEAVDDRAQLKSREMTAYWRLMDWSLTQPFADLEARAKDDVPFTRLWDQPELYRGTLIRIRMHVRRVLEYDAPENPSGLKKVYEAWGWTDESKSFPYVVVFTEPPEALPIGTDIRAEIVFVGYFFKIMTYKAFDNTRGAPLLIGRAHLVSRPAVAQVSKSDPWMIPLVVIGATCFIGFSVWSNRRSRRKSRATILPTELSDMTATPEFGFDNPFSHIDAVPAPSRPKIPVVTADEHANQTPVLQAETKT